MDTDYIIVGQGLCGTFLSYYLTEAGKSVIVVDELKPNTASYAASGIINPVTGRRIVKTWMIDELMPFAIEEYATLENKLATNLIHQYPLIDFHTTPQMMEAFEKRQTEDPQYLQMSDSTKWKDYFNFYFGAGEVTPCLLINIHNLLTKWRQHLNTQNALLNEHFLLEELAVENDYLQYKNISAGKIIFCDGATGADNPFFKNLPYSLNKGEALVVSIPGLPANAIYKHSISILPWQHGLFWVGSGYDWSYADDKPTEAFEARTIYQLKNWLKLPFEIAEHLAGIRPANIERRPFAGLHPTQPNVGILNGMGTKGCSLAPYFAKKLADHLVQNKPLPQDADVRRFTKALARNI